MTAKCDLRLLLLGKAIDLATERAASARVSICVYEARHLHFVLFYVRSETEGPPPRKDHAPESEVVPQIVRVVRPPNNAAPQ